MDHLLFVQLLKAGNSIHAKSWKMRLLHAAHNDAYIHGIHAIFIILCNHPLPLAINPGTYQPSWQASCRIGNPILSRTVLSKSCNRSSVCFQTSCATSLILFACLGSTYGKQAAKASWFSQSIQGTRAAEQTSRSLWDLAVDLRMTGSAFESVFVKNDEGMLACKVNRS